MRVRYEGPNQGITLLHHHLEQFGLSVTSMTPPAGHLGSTDQVVRVELDVAGDGDGPQLASRVRAALDAFTAMYHRAGLDLIQA